MAADLEALLRRLQDLEDALAKYQRNQRYLLETQGMHDRWQSERADNVDAAYPLVLRLYVPPITKHIQQVLLRFTIETFRAYETGAASANLGTVSITANTTGPSSITTTGASSSTTTGASSATTTGPSSVSTTTETAHYHSDEIGTNSADGTVGMHSHYVPIHNTYTSGAHSHGISHTHDMPHTHTMPHTHDLNHTHDMSHGHTIGSHTHAITFGIFTSTAASLVTVTINGINRTAALGGGAGFGTDQDSLDITQWITTGYNVIQLGSATLGRLHATLFVDLYAP